MKHPAITSAILFVVSGLFWFAAYERYFKYRHCIDALGNSSCRTADGSNVTAGGMVWAIIAFGLTALALVCAGIAVRRRRRA